MPFPLPKLDGSSIRRYAARKRPTLDSIVDIRQDLHKVKTSPSPFDRLPIEMQVEIFSYCLPPFPRFDADEGPLLIARVCNAWRSVVLSTSKFWSSFEIEVTGSGPSISLRDIRIMSTMELWLQRSRTYPLSVRVIHIPVGRVPDPRSAQLLALLIPEARRWRHVQFIIPTANMASIRHALPSEFPSLQSLTLHMKGLWTPEPSIGADFLEFPWKQLSSLDLRLEQNHLPNLNDCLGIIGQMEQVRECTLAAACTLQSADEFIISVPTLQHLHLILQEGPPNAPVALSQFFCRLSTPSLCSLNISWRIQENTIWLPAHRDFVSFLQSVSSTLRSLKLSYLPLSDVDLIDCLRHIPLVEDLELRNVLIDSTPDAITDQLLAALTLPPPITAETATVTSVIPPILPCLASVKLECNGSRLSYVALLSMIHSRRQSEPPFSQLRRVRLRSMKPVIGEIQRQVERLNKDDMDVSIESIPVL